MAEKGKDKTTSERTEMQKNQVVFDSANATNILHLSDLHFGAEKDSKPIADAEKFYTSLVYDLCTELGCARIDAVIISGDIGNFSKQEEYDAAEVFLGKLCTKFSLDPSRLIIVPGNHDLNWEISEESYQLIRRKKLKSDDLREGCYYYEEGNKDVIALRNDVDYPLRFKYFFKFYQTVTGKSYPMNPNAQATLHYLPNLNLFIAGFNSVWESDHHFKTRISINPNDVAYILNHILDNKDYKEFLKIGVWHHSFSSKEEDRIADDAFMQSLAQAGFEVCLHGHIHKSDAGLFRYDMTEYGRKIHIVGAGTFGAPVREWAQGYHLQYNLLRLSGNTLRVETRSRREINGTWGPDHMWRQGEGKLNLPYYDIYLSHRVHSEKKSESKNSEAFIESKNPKPDPVTEAEIEKYCQKAESLHSSLPVAGFAEDFKVPIDIEDIYIPLRAMVNLKGIDDIECYGDSCTAHEHFSRSDAAIEISLLDAFEQAEKRKRKGLVILGDPGSGKTTHMKRMLLWCLRKGPETMNLPKDMLPVFLPLRELKQINEGLDRFIQDQLTSRFLKMAPDFGQRMMERGNLLFLLDGLDEVADLAQREEVSAWIEEAFADYPDCRFVVTCRYAGYSPSVRLSEKFLEMHVRPLSEEEAEKFIRTWYAIVENNQAKDLEQAESIAQEKADDLVDCLAQTDFRARRVFEMTRNPLLLTNICLVHRHRGSLPQRRATLYEECVDVLLEHWRRSKKLELGVKALQGRQVLQPVALWLHQEEKRIKATSNELSPIIEPVLKEIQWPNADAQSFLRLIRDESGLLTGWDQENYGFMHLGFQEYLAAKEIRSCFQAEMNEQGRSDYLKNLAKHFGESWWQEVALLLLALEDPPLFVPYMREVVRHPSFSKHADFLEMCLDDAVKPSAVPFVELLKNEPGKNQNFWERQLLSLRIVERLDEEALKPFMDQFRGHPYEPIRQWVQNRLIQALQDVIRPEPSGYELVLIKGGTFKMGSQEYDSEKPVHEVTVPDFYMGRYPVTNEEYGRFIKAKGYKEPAYWGDRNYNQPRQPVVGVSWDDAKAFAKWAGMQLPSEAQWEYACRAGTQTRYSWGNEPDCSKANYGNSEYTKECKDINPGKPSAVGNYPPNGFGLYDMHGNVWEWCEDHYHDNYNKAPDDGSAWVDQDKGADRVLRGGSWSLTAEFCRSAYRSWGSPDLRDDSRGFRLVRLPGQPGEPGR